MRSFASSLGIGGGRSLGFGPNRVRSLPDGVAQALSEYLENTAEQNTEESETHPNDNGKQTGQEHPSMPVISLGSPPELPHTMRIGDLCPECGQAAVVNEEGCRKCYACGFSEC
jgi:ribonucleoside-diphosphate reductase alpha chain